MNNLDIHNYQELKRYFRRIYTGILSEDGLPDTNSFFEENPGLLFKALISQENEIDRIKLFKKLNNGKNKLNDENRILFNNNITYLLVLQIFKKWNKLNFEDPRKHLKELINDNIIEIELLSLLLNPENIKSDLFRCFYPDSEKLTDQNEKQFISEITGNLSDYVENADFDLDEQISQTISKFELNDGISLELLVRITKILFILNEYQNSKSEIYQTFCVLAEGNQPSVLIASLEIIKPKVITGDEKDIKNENIYFFSMDNTPELKNTNTERDLKEITQKVISHISEKRPEIKDQLFSNKYLFTLRSIISERSKVSIEGNSFDLPFMLILTSIKLYKVPISLENGICSTGAIDVENIEETDDEKIIIYSVGGFNDKVSAIKKYNQSSLFGDIKTFYVPFEAKNNFSEALKNEGLKEVDDFLKVKNSNEIYLKAVNYLFEIDFIDPYVDYVEEKSLNFQKFIKNENFDLNFNQDYEHLIDYKNFLKELAVENMDEGIRNSLLTDKSGESCLLDKEGLIIPCFIDSVPEKTAELFCNFLAYNREKIKFAKTPVPVMLPIEKLLKLEPEDYLFSVFKDKVNKSLIISTLKELFSFVFIIYDQKAEETDNPFRGENLISKLLGKHYLICIANSVEQANYWAKIF